MSFFYNLIVSFSLLIDIQTNIIWKRNQGMLWDQIITLIKTLIKRN